MNWWSWSTRIRPVEPYLDFAVLLMRCPMTHLVGGGSALFAVTAPANANVYNLKELILEKKKNELKDIDAHQLILFKVSTFLCFSRRERSKAVAYLAKLSQVDFHLETEDKDYLRSLDFKQEDVQNLTEARKHVSAIWLDQPLDNGLHVFVKRPAPGFVSSHTLLLH